MIARRTFSPFLLLTLLSGCQALSPVPTVGLDAVPYPQRDLTVVWSERTYWSHPEGGLRPTPAPLVTIAPTPLAGERVLAPPPWISPTTAASPSRAVRARPRKRAASPPPTVRDRLARPRSVAMAQTPPASPVSPVLPVTPPASTPVAVTDADVPPMPCAGDRC